MPVRTLIADDNDALRDALHTLLDDSPGVEVVGSAATGAETLRLADELAPDVAILDVDMPGGGPDLVRAVCALVPAPRVLVFSGRDDAETVLAMLAAGATAYVAKGGVEEDFQVCVRRCAEGGFFVMASCSDEVRRQVARLWAGRS